MERYSEYKDSGVQWLGEIPSHWRTERIANFFTERRTIVSDKDYAPLSVTKQGIFPQLENVAKTNDGSNRKLVMKGDFVINSRSDRKSSSGVSKLNGSVSLINIVLQSRESIYSPFTNYLLKSPRFVEEYYRNGHGIVADLWTTRFFEMKLIKISIPTLSEQQAITNYLDNITAKIDKAIEQQQKMIDLLNERKQIIISDAVTKGLDKNVNMKDSGVEWIGEIPSHWEVRKYKYITSYTQSGTNLTSFQIKDIGKYPVYGGNGVRGFYEYFNYNRRCIIIGRQGALCGNIHLVNEPFWATEHAVVTFANKNTYIDYLYYLSVAMNLNQYASQTAAQPGIAVSTIKNVYTCLPPFPEQQAIATYLDKKCEEIDKAIDQQQRMIDLLQERKKIIINDVVTGKVKVS